MSKIFNSRPNSRNSRMKNLSLNRAQVFRLKIARNEIETVRDQLSGIVKPDQLDLLNSTLAGLDLFVAATLPG